MPRILGARVAHLPVLDGARSWRGRMVDFVLRRLVLAQLLRYRHCRSAALVMWNRSSWELFSVWRQCWRVLLLGV